MQTALTDSLCTAKDTLLALARLQIRFMTDSVENHTSTTLAQGADPGLDIRSLTYLRP